MTVVAASIFTQFAGDPALAFTVVMMAGAFQVLFGYLRIGRYINLMPYPVISGFMTENRATGRLVRTSFDLRGSRVRAISSTVRW